MKKKIKWSKEVISITVFTTLLLITAEVSLIRSMLNSEPNAGKIIASIIILSAFVFCFANLPLYIKLTDTQFILKKPLGKITIDYNEIKLMTPFNFEITEIRVFGSGGFCGYLGLFSNKYFGNYFSFVTDRKQTFIIETKSKKRYAFSSNDYDIIADTIKEKLNI